MNKLMQLNDSVYNIRPDKVREYCQKNTVSFLVSEIFKNKYFPSIEIKA